MFFRGALGLPTADQPMGTDLITAYTVAMRQYLVVEGRMSRRDFWLFVLVIVAALLVALFIDAIFFSTPFVARRFLTMLVGAMHSVPFITASVRRLHDADLTGWLYLLNALPFGQVIFFILTCLPPTAGPNRYGNARGLQTVSAPTSNHYSPVGREPAVGTGPLTPQVTPVSVAHVAAPMPRGGAASLDINVLDQLERLASLRTNGVLTEAEFATFKAKLIASTGAAT